MNILQLHKRSRQEVRRNAIMEIVPLQLQQREIEDGASSLLGSKAKL